MLDCSGLKIEGDVIWIIREKGFLFNFDEEVEECGEGEEMIVGF